MTSSSTCPPGGPQRRQGDREHGAAGNIPGNRSKRFYPNGRTASHFGGFVNVDGSVMEGVEAQYNEVLAGKPGVVHFEKDSFGLRLPQAESTSNSRSRDSRSC